MSEEDEEVEIKGTISENTLFWMNVAAHSYTGSPQSRSQARRTLRAVERGEIEVEPAPPQRGA